MRKTILFLIALTLSTGLASAQSLYSSWSSAVSASRSSGKPMMVIFEQAGCPDCSRMNRNLAASQARQALSNVIRVRLEYRSNPTLANRFGIGATPTTLVFAPNNTSDPIFHEVGAMSVDSIAALGRSLNSRYGSGAVNKKSSAPKKTKKAVRDASPISRTSAKTSRKPAAQVLPTIIEESADSQPVSSRAQRQQAYQRADRQAVPYYYY